MFFSVEDEVDVVQLDYTVTKAAQAYSDVGELYWQFVGSGWAEDSSDVTMTLNLPSLREPRSQRAKMYARGVMAPWMLRLPSMMTAQ